MNFLKKNWKIVIICALVLANIFVWGRVYAGRADNTLSVYFLDIGQGDAIFVESPSHGRLLIDGGKNRKVLSELGKILPFADKRIDIVLATHPDLDHIGGLPEVVSRYDVGLFIESGVTEENSVDTELENRLEIEKADKLIAERGMTIDFGDGVKFTILFPNQDVSWWPTNDASIVAKLSYGEHDFILTGDATARTESILLNLGVESLNAEVLKAGHHGSRTSTTLEFAQAVSPEYAIISAGKDNSYNHPHQEVLDILDQVGAEILSTIEMGTIEFETDGRTLELK